MTIMDGQSTAERLAASATPLGLDPDQLAAQYGWVRAVARNLVRDPWGAEDVTQETLLAALASPPPDVPDDQRLRAWLGRVAFNLSRLGVRQGARRRAREVREARAEAMPSVSDELESAATVSALSRAIGELSEPDRRVVMMRYFDGLSTAAIAAHTGVSELAVRKRLWRARNKLRATLEPEHKSGILGLVLAGAWLIERRTAASTAARGWQGLAGLAAGLALCVGATWWWGRAPRESEPRVARAAAAESGRIALQAFPALPDDEAESPPGPELSDPARRSWLPPAPKAPADEPVVREEERELFVSGTVLDLDGHARAGLELVAAGAPAEVLATTDALGGFRLAATALPLALEARGQDVATVLRAEFERADDAPRLLLVAPGLDLSGRVVDADGLPLPDARLELRCDERAFARVEQPVRLASAVLSVFGSDAGGRFERALLPRAAGLFLRIERAGFERLERPTLALGADELFVLEPTPTLGELSGTVRHRDGRPAVGANVRLARASTTTDVRGEFRLPLRGVQPDSPLEASDKRAGPVRLPRFGSKLGKRGPIQESVDIVLGEEYDSVTGRLIGAGAAGWLVAVYPQQGGERDEKGNELPAAVAYSDLAGKFELSLPRGIYALHALAPHALLVARQSGLDTRVAPWNVELPSTGSLADAHGHVRGSDGVLLAGARLNVGVLLDGVGGGRRLDWRALETDGLGYFGFPGDPELAIDVSVAHDDAASAELAPPTIFASTALGMELVLARPAFLQVAAAEGEACAVLDAGGELLATRGPLHMTGASFPLSDGRSAVLEIPAAARWLELERSGAEPVRVPIDPRPGQLLRVRP